jgi:aminomuconate-semialdehyde/2-hydroxymuconate-6-semialdehyde dehydrogenase
MYVPPQNGFDFGIVFRSSTHAGFVSGPMKIFQNYIDGRFVRGSREFPDINPADGTVVAKVSAADRSQVGEAVGAAASALRGDWGKLSIPKRAAFLHKIADGIEARFQ